MLVKRDAPKPKLIGLRIWTKAIPQFNVGHQDLLEVILKHRLKLYAFFLLCCPV